MVNWVRLTELQQRVEDGELLSDRENSEMLQLESEQSDKGAIPIGDQPVALPIHLVRNYLIKHAVAVDKR